MRILGLTGGIATGKSTAAKFFEEAGVPVIDADQLARRVVEPGRPAHKALRQSFGPEYFHSDGRLNREKLGLLVFADEKYTFAALKAILSLRATRARKRLNACTHPFVRLELILELLAMFFNACPLVVFDSALLIETKTHRFTWPVVVVDCDPLLQHSRVMTRDHLSAEDAQNRINAQLPLSQKRKMATVVIDNSATIESTRSQVAKIKRDYMPSKLHTLFWYYVLYIPLLIAWRLLKVYASLYS